MKKILMLFLMLLVTNNCFAILPIDGTTNAEIKEEIARFTDQFECETHCTIHYKNGQKNVKTCQSYCKKFADHKEKIENQTSEAFLIKDCLNVEENADEVFSYSCYEAWEEMFSNIKDEGKNCNSNIDKFTIFKAFSLDKLSVPNDFTPMIECYQKEQNEEEIESQKENITNRKNEDKQEQKQESKEKEDDAYCDSEEGRKDKRKCKRKEKIAEKINSDFKESLKYWSVKDKCEGLISKKGEIFTDKKTLAKFTPKQLRKCRRTARKVTRLINKAKKHEGATENCLNKNTVKIIRKCIKKVKIKNQINKKFSDYLKYSAVQEKCKILNNVYSDKVSPKNVRQCKRSARKMKRFVKKAKRKCKKLERKIKKCNKKSYDNLSCSYSGISPNCDVINAGDLESYKSGLKTAKEALKTFRKAKRQLKKDKRKKKRAERKKKKTSGKE